MTALPRSVLVEFFRGIAPRTSAGRKAGIPIMSTPPAGKHGVTEVQAMTLRRISRMSPPLKESSNILAGTLIQIRLA